MLDTTWQKKVYNKTVTELRVNEWNNGMWIFCWTALRNDSPTDGYDETVLSILTGDLSAGCLAGWQGCLFWFQALLCFHCKWVAHKEANAEADAWRRLSSWTLCIQTIDLFCQAKIYRFRCDSSYVGISPRLTFNMVITYKWNWNIHPSIHHCWWHWVSLGCCRLSELSGESGVHP